MADRASMPLFVPRTVAAFERSATLMARRVTSPARSLAGRALAFADRVLGSWAATGGEGERPAMRAAERSGAMVVPRPWYEEPA
ncbi:MAG TPA: hypothetical protein VIA18_23105, partial [Polyangia bacterium]|nr:hypothetical protein [Polyangia bacterium]